MAKIPEAEMKKRWAAAGAGTQQANIFARSLASVKPESWKSGSQMMQYLRDIDWDKGSKFFHSFQNLLGQFGVFSELITPILDAFDMMDAAMIEAMSEEIIAWNQAMQDMGKAMAQGVKDFDKWWQGVMKWRDSVGGFNQLMEDFPKIMDSAADAVEDFIEDIKKAYSGDSGNGGRRKPPSQRDPGFRFI